MAAFLAEPARHAQFVAVLDTDRPVGLVEVSVRRDYVNGTTISPVPFLEGLYVTPNSRREGLARQLLASVAEWARAQGYSELASDVPLDNELSQAAHRALGFTETERVVFFRKVLA